MAAACLSPLPLYRPRDPQASDLWRLVDRHFETFSRVYEERFQAKYVWSAAIHCRFRVKCTGGVAVPAVSGRHLDRKR